MFEDKKKTNKEIEGDDGHRKKHEMTFPTTYTLRGSLYKRGEGKAGVDPESANEESTKSSADICPFPKSVLTY